MTIYKDNESREINADEKEKHSSWEFVLMLEETINKGFVFINQSFICINKSTVFKNKTFVYRTNYLENGNCPWGKIVRDIIKTEG